MTIRQWVYVALGLLNVGLGALGLFLPLLPTTPFLLLAAFFFSRSNQHWYRWLLDHPHLGPYIHAFRNKTGLTRKQKIRIGASFTTLMAITFYVSPLPAIQWAMVAGWCFWTVVLIRMKTAREPGAMALRSDDRHEPATADGADS